MANTKSAKKATRAIERRNKQNDLVRNKIKSSVKQYTKAVQSGDKKTIEETQSVAYKQLDKAAKRNVNVISKNKASRMKSRLAKMSNKA